MVSKRDDYPRACLTLNINQHNQPRSQVRLSHGDELESFLSIQHDPPVAQQVFNKEAPQSVGSSISKDLLPELLLFNLGGGGISPPGSKSH